MLMNYIAYSVTRMILLRFIWLIYDWYDCVALNGFAACFWLLIKLEQKQTTLNSCSIHSDSWRNATSTSPYRPSQFDSTPQDRDPYEALYLNTKLSGHKWVYSTSFSFFLPLWSMKYFYRHLLRLPCWHIALPCVTPISWNVDTTVVRSMTWHIQLRGNSWSEEL